MQKPSVHSVVTERQPLTTNLCKLCWMNVVLQTRQLLETTLERVSRKVEMLETCNTESVTKAKCAHLVDVPILTTISSVASDIANTVAYEEVCRIQKA